jgi:hypothetical protein
MRHDYLAQWFCSVGSGDYVRTELHRIGCGSSCVISRCNCGIGLEGLRKITKNHTTVRYTLVDGGSKHL